MRVDMTAKAKATVKKVASKLRKASKAHAGQAKTLSALKLNKGGSTVNKAGNYTKPTMRKNLLTVLKQEVKAVEQVNGLLEKLRCLLNNIKQQAVAISNGTCKKSTES